MNPMLNAHGKNNNNAPIEALPVPLKSTVFFNCATTITEQDFFKSNNIHNQYQNEVFPNVSQAYTINAISVYTDLVFDAGSVYEDQVNLYAHFIRNSYIRFEMEGNEVTEIPLHKCVVRDVANNGGGSVASGSEVNGISVREKISNVYQLPTPIKYASGKKMNITLRPASDLTSESYTAGFAGYYPKSNLNNTEHGFCVQLELDAVKYKETK